MMSLGKGVVPSSLLKQKLNFNISIEGDIVGEHYGMGLLLCSKHFVEDIGYTVYHKSCTNTKISPSLWIRMLEHQAQK